MTWRASSRSSRRGIERDNENASGGAGEGEPVKQAVWSGTINFGLVSIPVKLYPATEPKDVRFHLYDRRTGKRVRYERVTREYEPPTFAPEPPTFAPEPPSIASEREIPARSERRTARDEDVTTGAPAPYVSEVEPSRRNIEAT